LPASRARQADLEHASSDHRIVRRMAGQSKRLTSTILQQGNPMKLVIAAALLTISASAHAGTFSYEGVTVHLQDGCMSSSCVSVYAPGYGYYHGGHQARVRKVHKDTSRVASTVKKEDVAAAPGMPAVATMPANALEAASPAALTDAAPAK
jgi:hypothetical protein